MTDEFFWLLGGFTATLGAFGWYVSRHIEPAPTKNNFTFVLPDNLAGDINKAAAEGGISRGELARKAIQLYLATLDGKARGLKLGLVDPATGQMKTEIVGL